MKLQVQDRSLRLRVDEAGLAALLDGQSLAIDVTHAGRRLLSLVACIGPELRFDCEADAWRLVLPAEAIARYANSLPRRDGLEFELDGGLRLAFEVDVRDSVRRRRQVSDTSPRRGD